MEGCIFNKIKGILVKTNNILLALDNDDVGFDDIEKMISSLNDSCFNLVKTLRSRNFDKKPHPWR